jgi:hypothetical protein
MPTPHPYQGLAEENAAVYSFLKRTVIRKVYE